MNRKFKSLVSRLLPTRALLAVITTTVTVATATAGCAPEKGNGVAIVPTVDITVDQTTENSVTATFKPNSAVVKYAFAIGISNQQAAFEAGTIPGYTEVAGETGVAGETERSVTFDNLSPGTSYTVFARGGNRQGEKGRTTIRRATTLPSKTPTAKLRSVGYLASWDWACYATMDWTALTHLNIAFCNADDNGKMVNPFDSDRDFNTIVATAHANGVKVIASMGGGGGGNNYPALISTPAGRTALCDEIIAFVRKYGLDGIDSDLENGAPAFWTNYEPFILELRRRCDAEGLLLTTAVSTWFSDNITDATFACFDFVNIMAYDMGFANHSGLEDTGRMARHYRDTRHIPADRIVIGVPFYGYNKTISDNDPAGWNDFRSYAQIVAADPTAKDRDEWGDYVYNGIPTITAKCALAREYGGIMMWQMAQDATGEPSLLGVIRKNLFESGAAPRTVQN